MYVEDACIKSVVKNVSLHLEAWSITENKVEYKMEESKGLATPAAKWYETVITYTMEPKYI